MSTVDKSPFDFLSDNEAHFCISILEELVDQAWARPLVAEICRNGGITGSNKSHLFELRFAYSLHRAGIVPSYEVPGEGESSLDFGFTAKQQVWAVELMRLEETSAVRRATQPVVNADGDTFYEQHLHSNADDRRQSPGGETIKAVQRICQKCERDGRPYKFPIPNGTYHALLVDFRNFLNGGDSDDCIHVALGGDQVRNRAHKMRWNGEIITGVFDRRTKQNGAEHARQRIHFIGFVNEKSFCPGEFGGATQFVLNPQLFLDADEARAAIATWPLQPATIL